jgi:Vault protein inter-alpha-trypsin domain
MHLPVFLSRLWQCSGERNKFFNGGVRMLKMMTAAAGVLLCANAVLASLNFGTFYSRSVRGGTSYQTSVDSIEIANQVSYGLINTKVSLSITPVPFPQRVVASNDSIEITASFTLPESFVAQNMWLWINDKPVKAYVQRKDLATQQYNSIVGTRKDPALLTYNGNGSYSLRIFPALANSSRRIEIEFQHTFADDSKSSLLKASVPFMYDSVSFTGVNVYPDVKLSYVASDNKTYNVATGTASRGEFTASKPLTIESADLRRLDTCVITTADISGTDPYVWTGYDTIADKFSAGFTTELDDNAVIFENEPNTKIIALDIRSKTLDRDTIYYKNRAVIPDYYKDVAVWENAKKYAVLALRQYVGSTDKFNVLIGIGESVISAFDTPRAASKENLAAAMQLVNSVTPCGVSPTELLLNKTIAQEPKGTIILISDLFEYNATAIVGNALTPQQILVNNLRKIADTTAATIFTIDGSSSLYSVAQLTGGFRLADLLNSSAISYSYKVVDGKRVMVPFLPPLYGSSNYSGIQKLQITSEGLNDIYYCSDASYYYYRNEMVMDAMYYPSTYMNIRNLRIAGHLASNYTKSFKVFIQGKLGGMWFKKELTVKPDFNPASSAYRNLYDVSHAFTSAKYFAMTNLTQNWQTIIEVGMKYGITTTQTSLLALEPGVALWTDTVVNTVTTGAIRLSSQVAIKSTADMTYVESNSVADGISIDEISLKDLMNLDLMPVINSRNIQVSKTVTVSMSNNKINLIVPSVKAGILTARLFDLSGKLVFCKDISLSSGVNSLSINVRDDSRAIRSGNYLMTLSSSEIKNSSFRVTLTGR